MSYYQKAIEAILRVPGALGSGAVLAQGSWSRYKTGVPQCDVPADTRVPDHDLLRVIGRGAYGEVWLARHRTLGTLRAVKVVRRADFEDERPFRREFEGIRRYEPVSRSHPNLVPILHVGGDDTAFFYVMELADPADVGGTRSTSPTSLQGAQRDNRLGDTQMGTLRALSDAEEEAYAPGTLRHRIKSRGPGTAEDAIALGCGLAGALAHLHAHGLVHRDVKPSNVIFAGGVPKLADLGLVTDVGDSRSFVGTEGYIPPEGPGSASADGYALGKLLYEFATGRDRHDWPVPAADLATRPDRERLLELNAVLHRACAPKPADRYPDGTAMLADLERLGQGRSVRRRQAWQRRGRFAAALAIAAGVIAAAAWLLAPRFRPETIQADALAPAFPTLAVLPFDAEGGGESGELAIRLTEEIRAGLTRVPGLGVIRGGSSEELKRSGQALALARSNGIGAFLEGRVRRTADKVVVTVELTEARSGRLLWSKSMESSTADPTAVAIVVVQGVVSPLGMRLAYSQRNALATRPTENLQAQRLYWEARALFAREGGLEAALPKLREAIQLDVNFALAHADIAGVNITLAELCPRSPTNYWPEAKAAAERSYALAPNSMEANLAMAGLKETFEYDWAAAETFYVRGIESNPANGEPHWLYGLFLAKAGRVAEARKHRERALQLDPLEPMNDMNLGHQLFYDEGKPDLALGNYLKAISKQPSAGKSLDLGNLYLTLGRDKEALNAYEGFLLGNGITADSVQELRAAHARAGWRGYWQRWLGLMDQSPKYYRWFDRAQIHDRLGQTSDVIECLRKSIENREFYATGIRNPNSWKPYRSDPRFKELLRMLRVDEAGRPRLE